MSANFKVMSDDNQFLMEMNRVPSNRLVAVDFTSARCPPCVQIAPLFHGLASKYKNALFLKVDIHNCPMAAQSQAITATPTFILFRNKVKIDSIRGADIEALEAKIRNHYGDGTNSMEDNDECGVPGHMDLVTMIYKAGSECLNESDDNTFGHALSPSAAYLESDADEQLILYIAFNQAVKVHSLRIKGPEDNGPKNVKLFINQPYTLDFDAAETATPIQELELTKKELLGELMQLKYVRFQNVMNLTLFVQSNQNGCETSRISYIQLIGSPVQTTNMSDFKRIAGKKGESHW